MPSWLQTALAVASIVAALTGPVNTWAIFRRSAQINLTPDRGKASHNVLRRASRFLFSVYTLSAASIIYNLWYGVHLVHGQNGVTVSFVVRFTTTVAIICYQLMLILLKWTTDLIDKSITGILDLLPQHLALITAITDQVRTLIDHDSSSLEIIGGVQTSVVETLNAQKKVVDLIENLTEFQIARRWRGKRPT